MSNISIPDPIQPEETSILFVGINPSASETDAARQGHYFRASRNRFYQYLFNTGLISETCRQDTDVFNNYNISFTNSILQATNRERDITTTMMLQGRQRLRNFLQNHNIQSVCFVGNKCARHFLQRRRNLPNYGFLTHYTLPNGVHIPIYSVPSGSGRVRIPVQQIQAIWQNTIDQITQQIHIVQLID
ncbi:uracil-DNA glycosylase-like protein [Blakeslea trispora]|nr:uracil-DNA glycosylase-like protein [Blakeslea trispora]